MPHGSDLLATPRVPGRACRRRRAVAVEARAVPAGEALAVHDDAPVERPADRGVAAVAGELDAEPVAPRAARLPDGAVAAATAGERPVHRPPAVPGGELQPHLAAAEPGASRPRTRTGVPVRTCRLACPARRATTVTFLVLDTPSGLTARKAPERAGRNRKLYEPDCASFSPTLRHDPPCGANSRRTVAPAATRPLRLSACPKRTLVLVPADASDGPASAVWA